MTKLDEAVYEAKVVLTAFPDPDVAENLVARAVLAMAPVVRAADIFTRDSYRPEEIGDGKRFDALCEALAAMEEDP